METNKQRLSDEENFSANYRYLLFLIKKPNITNSIVWFQLDKISPKLTSQEYCYIRDNLAQYCPYLSKKLFPQDWEKDKYKNHVFRRHE